MLGRLVYRLIEKLYLSKPNNLAFYCQKTLVYNQNWWELYAKKHLESESFNIVILDLNNFKQYNDNFGHLMGDNLLRSFAHRLKLTFGDGFICRVGGDEFVILTNYSEGEIIGKLRILKDYNFSFGISYKSKTTLLDEAYVDADMKMYSYKSYSKECLLSGKKARNNN